MKLKICALALALLPLTLAVGCEKKAEPAPAEEVKPEATPAEGTEAAPATEGAEVKTEGTEVKAEEKK
ncbi:MAG: hypothetical protein LBB40_05575 [Holophagales bacterium]|jgi:hypothetical protein|nr:hypothetical protein [Holophagales bacterium]